MLPEIKGKSLEELEAEPEGTGGMIAA